MTQPETRVRVRIRSAEYTLTADQVLAAAAKESPRKINAYFVELGGQRYPPKQLLKAATGTTELFDSALAVRVLRNLGFDVQSVQRQA